MRIFPAKTSRRIITLVCLGLAALAGGCCGANVVHVRADQPADSAQSDRYAGAEKSGAQAGPSALAPATPREQAQGS